MTEDLQRRQPARRAHDAAARMRAGATLPVSLDRRAVPGEPRYRTKKEELVQRQFAAEDVSLGEPGDPLDVGRRDHLTVHDEALKIRRVLRQRVYHCVAERLSLRIGPTAVHV